MRPDARSDDRANPPAKNKSMYYVYFLLLSNTDIYKGSCANIDVRVKEHELGKVESTRNFRPVKLLGYEAYLLKSDALRREMFLKTTEGRRLLNYRDIINQERKRGRVVEGAALEKP
ncbi:MAG: GIY-YIG nuclease family protein [Candidatus Doudnabacteria bacterium]|nr:GIY-YIG nuclease family protein [Candidatus Doudnabacteria bacterium]